MSTCDMVGREELRHDYFRLIFQSLKFFLGREYPISLPRLKKILDHGFFLPGRGPRERKQERLPGSVIASVLSSAVQRCEVSSFGSADPPRYWKYNRAFDDRCFQVQPTSDLTGIA